MDGQDRQRLEAMKIIADKGLEWKAKYESAKEELLKCVQWQHDLRQELAASRSLEQTSRKLREMADKVRAEYWCEMNGAYNIAADMLLAEADRLDSAVKDAPHA